MNAYLKGLALGVGSLLMVGMVGNAAAGSYGGAAPTAKADIVDTAIAAGSFTTLVQAIQAAGLVDTLRGAGPFTVFAPTDAAFAKIPAAELEALLADKDALVAVLTHHVVAGRVMASDVIRLDSAATVQGESLAIDTSMGVKVGAAKVISTDIEASNGVVHVIDTVLIPGSMTTATAFPAVTEVVIRDYTQTMHFLK